MGLKDDRGVSISRHGYTIGEVRGIESHDLGSVPCSGVGGTRHDPYRLRRRSEVRSRVLGPVRPTVCPGTHHRNPTTGGDKTNRDPTDVLLSVHG